MVRKERPTRRTRAPLAGLLFEVDGEAVPPTVSHGAHGRSYRYYLSSSVQLGRKKTDDHIRRVSAPALEALLFHRLTEILDLGAEAGWAGLRTRLQRITVGPDWVRIGLDFPGGQSEVDHAADQLGAGEALTPDPQAEGAMRLTLPVRVRFRGGRTQVTQPKGLGRRIDRTLLDGLRSARSIATLHGLVGGIPDAAPTNAYERTICRLAFLAPDIQQASSTGAIRLA